MTKISVAAPTVTLPGVTHRSDLLLVQLWLDYARALGPFDFAGPEPDDSLRAGMLSTQYLQAHDDLTRSLRAVRAFIAHEPRPLSDFATCISEWLRVVDLPQLGGLHGIRQAVCWRVSKKTSAPIFVVCAEPLMRARCDDALIRLEGRPYNDLYTAVLSDIRDLCLSDGELAALRSTCEWARGASRRAS